MNTMPDYDDPVKKWKTLTSAIALDEKWFRVRKDIIQLPSGKIIDDYFVWESPSYSSAIPYTEDGKFVIIQQYQHAINKVIYQFPGGSVDPGETPERAAIREMMEEVGYASDDLTQLLEAAPHGTKITGWTYMFLAKSAKRVAAPVDDPAEQVEVLLVTPDELWELITSNQFQVLDSLAGALLALRHLGFDEVRS